MRKMFLFTLACAGLSFWAASGQAMNLLQARRAANQPAQQPDAAAKAEANLRLEAARMYLDLGDMKNAREQITAALKAAEADKVSGETKNQIQQDVKSNLKTLLDAEKKAKTESDEKNKQKHLVRLEEARFLLSEGKAGEATKIVEAVLGETDDPEVRAKAEEISSKSHSFWFRLLNTVPQRLLTIWQWVVDIILAGLVLTAIYLLLILLRSRSAKKRGDRWMVKPIEDSSNLGINAAVVNSLNRWKESRVSPSSGLMKLEMINISITPQFEDSQVGLDLADALKDVDLKVGTISIGGLAKAAGSIRNWFTAFWPSIGGTVIVSGEQVVVSLTRRTADGKTNTVTASAGKSESIYAAEAASFKMYYLIATETDVPKAEAANKLREGLNLLGQYLSGRTPGSLNAAYKAFREVQIENPAFDEAYLYEGITLDLLERHDEAVKRFHYLAQPGNTSNEKLREKARYNEAVSRFRSYNPEKLNEAIEMLGDLTGANPSVEELVASPIKALSYAAKANAIAHKPIFWQEFLNLLPEYKNEPVILQRKRDRGEEVGKWVAEVEEITNELEEVCAQAASNQTAWDSVTLRQLRWAIENARGNIYLNYAKSFLHRPHLEGADEENQRREHFEKAYAAFQNCEMILPPGVETLTNLGTVLSELSRQDEARKYLERAIELNPQYEYAYYRLAQTWEKENNIYKVVEALRKFRSIKTPGIPGFQELYKKYGVA
ncbi:MAG: tetratricopeptide repeat protein [Blastocatellia bacterium]|nr:tetratricopeptide repeat protein [Blastocatellia bacterium]